jgi:monoamine oxidase
MDVVIVGAGLAGLTAADELHRAGLSVRVLEARQSVGGRLKTLAPGGGVQGAWFDLGATWHWSNQPAVRELAEDLGVASFPQYREGLALVEDPPGTPARPVALPAPSPAELRFVGGAQGLCHRLAARLPAGCISFGTEVTAVAANDADTDGLTVWAVGPDDHEIEIVARAVVVAVPPRLASAGISFTPPLPASLTEVMQATPTWMATALKCVAVYDSAFWREAGRSGLALNLTGPLLEVHDACTDDGSAAGLWGFLSADHAYRDLGFDERRPSVFSQLGRLFGPPAADPTQYFERDWSGDPYTNDEVVWLDAPLGYGHPALARPALGGRLVWAGTETSEVGGGHMEGAVRSGRRAAGQVLHPGPC